MLSAWTFWAGVLEWNFLYKRAAYAKRAPKTKKMQDKSQPKIDSVPYFHYFDIKKLDKFRKTLTFF